MVVVNLSSAQLSSAQPFLHLGETIVPTVVCGLVSLAVVNCYIFSTTINERMPSRRGARPQNASSVHYIAIKSHMSCGACSSTVDAALRAVPGVVAVEVHRGEDQLAIATSDDDAKCCAGSQCKRGDHRQCMSKALVAASKAVGFDACATGSRALSQGGSGGGGGGRSGGSEEGSVEGKAAAAAAANASEGARVRNVAIGVALVAVTWMAARRVARQ
jgi:copper chaperone CopZ